MLMRVEAGFECCRYENGYRNSTPPPAERIERCAKSIKPKVSNEDMGGDDQACAAVMRRYRLANKSAAVNFALRRLSAESVSVEEARALRGTGWEGDLDLMRSGRSCGSLIPRQRAP